MACERQFVLGLQTVLPGAGWGLASSVLGPMRRTKDAEEIALLRAAAQAADRAIERIIAGRSGRPHRGGRGPGRA